MLEVGGQVLDDRCMSLVVVGVRRRTQRVVENFWRVNNLQRSWGNAWWAFWPDGGRSVEISRDWDESAEERSMNGGNPANVPWTLRKRHHTYSPCRPTVFHALWHSAWMNAGIAAMPAFIHRLKRTVGLHGWRTGGWRSSRTVREWQENVVGRSKIVRRLGGTRMIKGRRNGVRTVALRGCNHVSRWEDFRNFLKCSPAFGSENNFSRTRSQGVVV